MALVKFPRKEFEKHVKLTAEIQDKITMFGTPLEAINSDEVSIEIFPNRPDLLSLQGYIRAFLAFLNKKTGLKEYTVKKSGEKLIIEKSLPKQWPYAFACIVKGLKFDDEKIKEIIQIQEKLGATMLRNRKKGGIGVYPLQKITFPVRFCGIEPDKIKFRPLEYPEIITGKQILSKHPTGREYAHICQDWNKLPVFIDKKGVVMSMPPIINSHDVGKIDETTKDLFIEVTGNDFNILQKALTIIVASLADMGGQIYSIDCRQQTGKEIAIPNFTPGKMKISIEDAENLLGIELKEADVKKYLERMGFGYKNKEVSVPAWRTDILHPVDIYEDIAIAYGYDKFIAEIPEISTVGKEDKKEIIKRKIAEILCGLGLLEVSSYHLLNKQDLKKTGIKQEIEVERSKTDYTILRPNLLSSNMKILSENVDSEYPQKIFEIGRVFRLDSKHETGINESDMLLVSLTPSNFTEIKEALDYLEKMLGLKSKIEIKPAKYDCFIEGRTGKLSVNGKEIGIIGEIHPQILKNWHLKMPVSLLEISLEEIFRLI